MFNETAFVDGLKTNFAEAYGDATPIWSRIAVEVKSDGKEEEYGWLGGLAGMREMFGERMPQKLKNYDFSIKNREFEESVEVLESDIEDNRLKAYEQSVRILGENFKLFPDDLVFQALNDGFTKVAYDGQNFFDTDHVQKNKAMTADENWSNKGTTELSTSTFAAARLALETARTEKGKIVNKGEMKFLVVVPPNRRSIAEALFTKQYLAGGENNPDYQAAEILVTNQVDSNKWFVIDVSSPTVRPIVWQNRKEVPFEQQGVGSRDHFMRKKIAFGTYRRGNAGYGEYRKAYGSLVA